MSVTAPASFRAMVGFSPAAPETSMASGPALPPSAPLPSAAVVDVATVGSSAATSSSPSSPHAASRPALTRRRETRTGGRRDTAGHGRGDQDAPHNAYGWAGGPEGTPPTTSSSRPGRQRGPSAGE